YRFFKNRFIDLPKIDLSIFQKSIYRFFTTRYISIFQKSIYRFFKKSIYRFQKIDFLTYRPKIGDVSTITNSKMPNTKPVTVSEVPFIFASSGKNGAIQEKTTVLQNVAAAIMAITTISRFVNFGFSIFSDS